MKPILTVLGIALVLGTPASGSIIVRVNGEAIDFVGVGPRTVNVGGSAASSHTSGSMRSVRAPPATARPW